MTPLKTKTPLVEEEGHKLILLLVKILLKVVSCFICLFYFVSYTYRWFIKKQSKLVCPHNMSLMMRQPAFGIFKQVRPKQACSMLICNLQFSRHHSCFRQDFQILLAVHIGQVQFSNGACQCEQIQYSKTKHIDLKRTISDASLVSKALLTPTPRPAGDLFATDFFATDWRSMRLVQPLYVHIRIEIIIADKSAIGLQLVCD